MRYTRQIRQFLEGNLECDRGTHGPVFPTNAPLEAYDEEHKPVMVADNGANSSSGGSGGGISYYLRRASVQASVRHMAADVSDAVSSLAGRIGLVHSAAAAVYSADDPAATASASASASKHKRLLPTAAVPGRKRRSSDPGKTAITASSINGTTSSNGVVSAIPARQGPVKLPPLQVRNVRGDDSSVASN
jgi:hypothetical protein